MFIGEYITQLGEKNRLAIPKKLRTEMQGKIYLTRGYDKCLLMVDQTNWEALLKNINAKPLLNINVRDTKRYILGGAIQVDPDLQGRFVVTESLLIFSGITEKAIFIGVGEWIEIWNFESWENKLNNLTNNVAELANRLNELGK